MLHHLKPNNIIIWQMSNLLVKIEMLAVLIKRDGEIKSYMMHIVCLVLYVSFNVNCIFTCSDGPRCVC